MPAWACSSMPTSTRLPGLEPVGLTTAEVTEADFVFVSHAHFDHLYGADAIALRTGATVVASPESAVACAPAACRRAAAGRDRGETVQCGPTTKVRVLPALHSCCSPTATATPPSPVWATSM